MLSKTYTETYIELKTHGHCSFSGKVQAACKPSNKSMSSLSQWLEMFLSAPHRPVLLVEPCKSCKYTNTFSRALTFSFLYMKFNKWTVFLEQPWERGYFVMFPHATFHASCHWFSLVLFYCHPAVTYSNHRLLFFCNIVCSCFVISIFLLPEP